MKLAPVNSMPRAAYPERAPRQAREKPFAARICRVAAVVGTSLLLGISACGASERHTEEMPLPGVPQPANFEDQETDDEDDDQTVVSIIQVQPAQVPSPPQVMKPPPQVDVPVRLAGRKAEPMF